MRILPQEDGQCTESPNFPLPLFAARERHKGYQCRANSAVKAFGLLCAGRVELVKLSWITFVVYAQFDLDAGENLLIIRYTLYFYSLTQKQRTLMLQPSQQTISYIAFRIQTIQLMAKNSAPKFDVVILHGVSAKRLPIEGLEDGLVDFQPSEDNGSVMLWSSLS
ncbi:predicted protein [Coccidioides posadasii str. Silveira]|uniref:Predicted protein n=1 Tax=Coccidioides posadasii (strain RMSCC 757 / Silveira) TaxID=443226 RepID=E9D419_COCPS|nr:predicted protein [Coccidioides posadasii str. Silveira]